MRYVVLAIATLALSGCGVELLATTATTSTLQAQQLNAVRGQLEHAAGASGKVNLQRAIDTYHAEKGHYPATLEALVPEHIASVPLQTDGTSYVYNAVTGRISEGVVTGPTPEDVQQMQAISAAIQQFGRQTRRYPGSLEALVPRYLPAVPLTSSGEAFLYDPRSGRVAHRLAVAMPAPGQPHPGYAGGPMGEAMTGIGMQRELNNSSNAGVNAAGSRANDASRGFGNARSQHQLDTMDQLGL
jgi:type II secretory pathway pseudopilin PulG